MLDEIAVGHRVLVDGGSIHAVVTATRDDWFDIVVTHPAYAKLEGGKGINLPDSDMPSPRCQPMTWQPSMPSRRSPTSCR